MSTNNAVDQEKEWLPQIEIGTKITFSDFQPTFIFASLWPSWLFAVKAHGYKRVVVYVEDEKPGVQAIAQVGLSGGGKWLNWARWKAELTMQMAQVNSKPVLILFQGPRDAHNRLLDFLNRLQVDLQKIQLLAFLTGGDSEGRRISKKRLKVMRSLDVHPIVMMSHRMVGGVIDYSWSLESNMADLERYKAQLERQTSVKAILADYLSHTQGGKTIEVASGDDNGDNFTLPWKRRVANVLARSVFSPTGWVRREITLDELMDAYDIGVMDRKSMRAALDSSEGGFPREFTQQVPVRVLIRCLDVIALIKRENETETPHDVGQVREYKESAHVSVEKEMMVMLKQGRLKKETTGVSEEAKLQAKNDDATARVCNWNRRVCAQLGCQYRPEVHDSALDKFRELELRWYRSHKGGVIQSFRRYMTSEYGHDWLSQLHSWNKTKKQRTGRDASADLIKDYEVGIDAISRALAASFWEWDDGSTVFFWRWTKEHRNELRDGLKVWYQRANLPSYWGFQRWPEDPSHREQLQEKLSKVVRRRYVSPGLVKSLTSFFAVPKGVGDIRVVYDATKSGLNKAIWTPNFGLPNIGSVLHNSDDRTFYGDIDIGEMFLNYFLDPDLRPWAGVDISSINPEQAAGKRVILRWNRALMGVRSSPFNCVRAYLISEEIIKGDRRARSNPFRWHRVILNLPGTQGYNPSRPWVYKWDEVDQAMAAFVLSYVDDLRTGSSKGRQDCERVTHVAGSKLNYLGEQDASRKRGEASQEPGAWAGSVIISKEGEGLYVSISQEKWDKVKGIVEGYANVIDDAKRRRVTALVSYKQLEKDTGFLVHIFMTYELLRPYLKGFYLTMNSWRYDRGKDGWKYGRREWEDLAEEFWKDGERWEEFEEVSSQGSQDKAPSMIRVVQRLEDDINGLRLMFQEQTPSLRLIRGFSVARVLYGFGDASGAGFGASWVSEEIEATGNRAVHYRFGRWGSESEGESSNFRELRNLVDTLSLLGKQGELSGVEIFIFTDNSTAEAAFCRGSSSNQKLYGMIREVKAMEMLFETRVHVVHVAGKRMIAQGTDGLSRGCLADGVMEGKEMTSFVPLHLSAVTRSTSLMPWLQYGSGGRKEEILEVLTPEEWYEKGHDIAGGTPNCDGVWTPTYRYGNFVWSPPPCVAEQCLEELRRARHKRQRSTHVFVCPKIMSYASWQRQLFRSADVVIQIPAGHPAWITEQYESLIVGFYFPYLAYEPWQLKNANTILGMARKLQRMCKTDPSSSGLVLRELWEFTRKLPNLSERVVQRVLQGTGRDKVSSPVAGKRRRIRVEEEAR